MVNPIATYNRLLIGPPGTGKSMLAKRMPIIHPPLKLEEPLENTKLHSIVGLFAPVKALPANSRSRTRSVTGLCWN